MYNETIIHGTMRAKDLVPVLADKLHELSQHLFDKVFTDWEPPGWWDDTHPGGTVKNAQMFSMTYLIGSMSARPKAITSVPIRGTVAILDSGRLTKNNPKRLKACR